MILKTAADNTKAFEAAFPGIPSNSYPTIDAQLKALASRDKTAKPEELSKIKGHLVLFPLQWLWEEKSIADTVGLPDFLFR